MGMGTKLKRSFGAPSVGLRLGVWTHAKGMRRLKIKEARQTAYNKCMAK
jgi:hypothetical protein